MNKTPTLAPKCPGCKRPCLSADGGRHVCLHCEKFVDEFKVASFRAAKPAPEAEPGESYSNEAEIVQAIQKALTGRGWAVYRVGQWRADFSGSDAGVPDLIAVYPADPPHPAVIKLLEVKTVSGRTSPAQQKLVDIGGSAIVRSVKDALTVCGYTQ